MHARLLTFAGIGEVDRALAFLRDSALPVLRDQFGFRGVSASSDRRNHIVSMLSLWANESALESSNRPLARARDEAVALSGGTVTVEHFEQVSESVARTPVTGTKLLLTRFRVDHRSLDDDLLYFESRLLPQLLRSPGFFSVRNLVDRYSGRGLLETSWENRRAMREAEALLGRNGEEAEERGILFGEAAYREVLLFEVG